MSEQQSDLRASVESAGKKRRNIVIGAAGVAVVALVAGGAVIAANLGGGGDAGASAAEERLSLRLAVGEDNAYTDAVVASAADLGLDLEYVNVADWVLPNTEVASGEFDGNAFQHITYLSTFNAENGKDLTPQFSTIIVQWGVFSSTLESLDDLGRGARIALPDDPSNLGRALLILESAGVIEVDDAAGIKPTVDDVTDNPLGVEFVQIAALTIPQQFDDPSLDAVVVGTSYFDPKQGVTADDALFIDDALAETSLPYVNVVASRADNADDPAWAVLEEAYRDERVRDAIEEEFFGTTIPVDVPVDTLRERLAELEASASA
ncbi:MetQ/NlpA family ABC transporter substrate-binding protein [Arenivirga flava]|uniref:Metal ABC transporter substrate-binding protein n=1 Tax=Arenivirga flava TaxID=1930060 RepID=A0AA37UJT0_9MICO|nr:MetQ/NlpA family ABC transporter substrate-binding protein [Arenivirga flava]GMA26841.1 metal ABC transporter substrate-binding protein [Arenivirga flava]